MLRGGATEGGSHNVSHWTPPLCARAMGKLAATRGPVNAIAVFALGLTGPPKTAARPNCLVIAG